MRVNIGQEDLANAILDQIDQMQFMLVFVRKPIRLKAQHFSIVSDSDEERSAFDV